jgi:hypothetical protein
VKHVVLCLARRMEPENSPRSQRKVSPVAITCASRQPSSYTHNSNGMLSSNSLAITTPCSITDGIESVDVTPSGCSARWAALVSIVMYSPRCRHSGCAASIDRARVSGAGTHFYDFEIVWFPQSIPHVINCARQNCAKQWPNFSRRNEISPPTSTTCCGIETVFAIQREVHE